MRYWLVFLLAFSSMHTHAQDVQALVKAPPKHIGLAAQLYPAGIIITGMGMDGLKHNDAIIARLGVNIADRQDFSPYNDNEKGWGFGGTIGYRKSFNIKYGQLFAGANIDIWNMWIDWRNNIGQPNETAGQTYTLVVQPWAEVGYQYSFKNTPLLLGVSFGFGREINAITNGKDVGQGWMRSVTISILYKIH